MANPGYVRSTDGSDADNGSTWALANATLAGAMADHGVGDRIWVSDNHAESSGSAQTITLPGTLASPNQVLCGDDAAEPPTALATTGTVTTTGASNIAINGSGYVYGLTLSAGSGAVNASVQLQQANAAAKQQYDTCNFILGATGSTAGIQLGPAGGSVSATEVEAINCGFRFGAAAQAITACGRVRIRGGSALAGGTNPTNFMEPSTGEPMDLIVNGFDFSNWSSSLNLIQGGAFTQSGSAVFRNCKLPASWSGALFSAALTVAGIRGEMWNCDAGDTNYRMWVEDYAGSTRDETTIVRSGGASDGDTALSWNMSSSADAEFPMNVLRSPEIFSERITSVGSSKTITVEIAQDGTTTALNDDEIWLEVQYLGTSGAPRGSFADDAKADILASAAAQTNSSASWSGLSGTNKKQKLEVTFTPQEKGVAICTVCLAKASATVYVDPVATVT